MSKKLEQIEAKRKKTIEVGDYVEIRVPYSYPDTVTTGKGKKKVITEITKDAIFRTNGTITKVLPDASMGIIYEIKLGSISVPSNIELKGFVTRFEGHSKHDYFKAEHVHPTFDECGSNPFKKERFRVDFYNQGISSILFKAGYGKINDSFEEPQYSVHSGTGSEHDKQFAGKTHGGVDFNPYVIDADGKKQYYQRDLVWTLEQKQLLIDSIYNGIEIGKFLFRYKSWEAIEQGMTDNGHGFSWECVDGKQRFFAILHFIQNKYPDSYGNYWRDLSPTAQHRLLEYHNLSYGEMGERAQDSDVIETFLTLNFCGTPMSKEHIRLVQSFNMTKD